MVVQGDRARGEHTPPAGHPRAPREVRILEVGEEGGVESAERVEHGAAMESQRRARAEDLDRLRLARARRLAESPLPGDAELVDLDPRRVDRVRPRGEPDLRGDRTHAGITLARGEQLTKRIRI